MDFSLNMFYWIYLDVRLSLLHLIKTRRLPFGHLGVAERLRRRTVNPLTRVEWVRLPSPPPFPQPVHIIVLVVEKGGGFI